MNTLHILDNCFLIQWDRKLCMQICNRSHGRSTRTASSLMSDQRKMAGINFKLSSVLISDLAQLPFHLHVSTYTSPRHHSTSYVWLDDVRPLEYWALVAFVRSLPRCEPCHFSPLGWFISSFGWLLVGSLAGWWSEQKITIIHLRQFRTITQWRLSTV